MKICEKEAEEGRRLRYRDLGTGDIFSWGDLERAIMIKTPKGHTYLTFTSANGNSVGSTWENCESISSLITRYPNACITLGDPE